MFIHRAIAACPRCNTEQEFWVSLGKTVLNTEMTCYTCSLVFDSSEFTTKLINMYDNLTVSSNLRNNISLAK